MDDRSFILMALMKKALHVFTRVTLAVIKERYFMCAVLRQYARSVHAGAFFIRVLSVMTNRIYDSKNGIIVMN